MSVPASHVSENVCTGHQPRRTWPSLARARVAGPSAPSWDDRDATRWQHAHRESTRHNGSWLTSGLTMRWEGLAR